MFECALCLSRLRPLPRPLPYSLALSPFPGPLFLPLSPLYRQPRISHPLRRVLVIYMPGRLARDAHAETRVLLERTDRCVAFDSTLSSLVQVHTCVARRMRAPSPAPVYWCRICVCVGPLAPKFFARCSLSQCSKTCQFLRRTFGIRASSLYCV